VIAISEHATSEHQEVAELLGAYVLDALDALEESETQRVEHHLAEYQRCWDTAVVAGERGDTGGGASLRR